MRKPINAVLLSAMSLCIILTGCSGSANTNKTSSKSNAASAGQPLDLSVEVFDRSDVASPNTAISNPMTKWIIAKVKKDININLTFVAVPRSEEKNKLNVMMAGGTAPDIIFTYSQSMAANFASNGGLTDLTSYIQKYAPRVTSQLKDGLQYGVMYGKQYAIPSKRVNDYDKHMTYINKTLLAKYGLTMPTTKEQLYKELVTVHKADPKIVPYAMAAPTNDVKYYENMVLSYAKYANTKELAEWNVDDTRLLAPGTQNGYKELNKWYNEGLVSKDFAVDTSEKQYEADISNGNVFAFTSGSTDPWDSWMKNAYEANKSQYLETLCFENDKGEYANHLYTPIGVYTMVPKKNEDHAQAALEYMNWLLNPDNFNQIRSGMAIGAAKKTSDGVYITGDVAAKGSSAANINDLSVFVQSNIEYASKDQYIKLAEDTYNTDTFKIDEVVKKYYEISKPKGSYLAPYFGVPGTVSAKNDTNVLSAIHSMAARVIACSESSFDSTFTKEYNNVQNLGLKDMIAERGQQYDSYKTSSK